MGTTSPSARGPVSDGLAKEITDPGGTWRVLQKGLSSTLYSVGTVGLGDAAKEALMAPGLWALSLSSESEFTHDGGFVSSIARKNSSNGFKLGDRVLHPNCVKNPASFDPTDGE